MKRLRALPPAALLKSPGHVLASLAAMTSLALPGGLALAGPPAQTQDTARIVVKNFMFAPTSLAVGAGSTVTWTNMDEEPHTVVSDAGLFRSGALDTSQSFSFKFDKPGTYRFICSIHPQMVGTIVVR